MRATARLIERGAHGAAAMAPQCRYHFVAMVMVAAARPLFGWNGNSISKQEIRKELAKRKIWRCPVAGCPWVDAVDSEADAEEDVHP